MMKFLFFLLMLMPICMMGEFSVFQWSFFFVTFMYIMSFNMNYYFMGISYYYGCDLFSYWMILLSLWILCLMILASMKLFAINYYYELFMFVLLSLSLSLIMAFSCMNLFLFYLFFEVSLLPTLLLIMGWGYQPERIEAGVYLLFYMMVFSMPMMMVIFYEYWNSNSLMFMSMGDMPNIFMYLCMNMLFFVKMPMFFIHLWLPKAHVEAPISGSMILAGVILKLGGYGLIRLMKYFSSLWFLINIHFIVISLFGAFVVSLICLYQSDMKMLIAYSSISHMGLVMSGILTMSLMGFWGSLILMMGHGLCSSGLFCLANISYDRSNSRSIYLNKGLINLMPSLSLWWFLFSVSNMSFPPSLNLFGEINLIMSLLSFEFLIVLPVSVILFFSAAYSLYLYSFTQHGLIYSGNFSVLNSYLREYLLMILHWVPLNMMVLKGDLLFNWI
uniref:NADH-ubiquinone oxidoreductase chain 4 n=1 Tax=Oomorphoides metallicus TaxID=2576292 RepID=A0A4P8DP75_9CUCU|nr:NADH dehydrogenase subunit 4 [Oomorphoides metallicus]QCL18078.1 NADH dehydrogenase subunit 4 [Oomorphoides metallicus]